MGKLLKTHANNRVVADREGAPALNEFNAIGWITGQIVPFDAIEEFDRMANL